MTPAQILAKRILARRRLIPYIQGQQSEYHAGWVHYDIASRLEKFYQDIVDKKSPRLMLNLPPRAGKSVTASCHFPAWMLGQNPKMDIILASYNVDLPLGFSRKIRATIRDNEEYHLLFPNTRLSKDSQAAESWMTEEGGSFVATGIGGPLTGRGAHCLYPTQKIHTSHGPMTAQALFKIFKTGAESPSVLSYNGDLRTLQWMEISHAHLRISDHYYRVITDDGRISKLTGEHPVCVGENEAGLIYRRVDDLRIGETLVHLSDATKNSPRSKALGAVQGMWGGVYPRVREVCRKTELLREFKSCVQQQLLSSPTADSSVSNGNVSRVREKLPLSPVKPSGEGKEKPTLEFLFQRLLWGTPQKNLCGGEPPNSPQAPTSYLRNMWDKFRSWKAGVGKIRVGRSLLLPTVLARSPENHAFNEAKRYPWATLLPARVQATTGNSNSPTGKPPLCCVWGASDRTTPPRQRQREQRNKQPNTCMRTLPQEAPPYRATSRVITVQRVEKETPVLDFTVPETHNFILSSNIPTLNCLIIDDYIKNAEESENNELHRKHLDWYQSTGYTRLSPGGGVLIIATRWSYSDLSGQLQQLAQTDPEADKFELIEYPAISERYEYRHRYTSDMRREVDEIPDLQTANQDWELLRSPMEPLHPERFSLDMLRRIKANLSNRIWSALYQQRPVPDEGLFFQKTYIKYMAALPAFSQANMYTALDFAISTKDANDYTALATGVQDSSALLIVENVTHFKRDTFSIVEAIINEAERIQNTYPYYNYEVGFENGAIFQTLEPVLKRRMLERRIFFTYRTLQPLTDKQARARPLQSLMEQERVYFLESISQLSEAVSELLQFPVGRNDDMVDALAWMARMSLNKSPPRDDTEQHRNKEKSWKDKLRVIMQGKSTSYMGA